MRKGGRLGWGYHLAQMPSVFDHALDDFTHGFADNEVVAIGKCDNRVGLFFDGPNEFGVDDKRFSVEPSDFNHHEPPFSPSEDEQLLHEFIGRANDAR